MDVIKINKFTESDFDQIIFESGGKRYVQDSSIQKKSNADYIVNEVIIELKLLDEEALEKGIRQKKIAALFKEVQPERPVVIIDPSILTEEQKRKYYNLCEGPIKTGVKKAAKQLDQVYTDTGKNKLRVLLIVNNGYSSLSMDEFKNIVLKCVRNDTSKIDFVILCGLYWYGDGYDNYAFTPFELVPINISKSFLSFDLLQKSWNQFINYFMTKFIREKNLEGHSKLPQMDIVFDLDGTTFIKPARKLGKSSWFWKEGERGRKNTTGISECPPVARTLPYSTEADWIKFKKLLPYEKFFRNTYTEWKSWAEERKTMNNDILIPFLFINIEFEPCVKWCEHNYHSLGFHEISNYAVHIFDTNVKEIINKAVEIKSNDIRPARYLLLKTEEIGQDKKYDISHLFYISLFPGFEREEKVFMNEQLFFEYALSLAGAYAIKYNINSIYYNIDGRYSWA
jgi:hypothetical protein